MQPEQAPQEFGSPVPFFVSSLALHIEARSFARKMIDVHVVGRDIGQIYDGSGVYGCRDRDGLANLFFRRARRQGFFKMALNAALTLGDERSGDRDQLLGLCVEVLL